MLQYSAALGFVYIRATRCVYRFVTEVKRAQCAGEMTIEMVRVEGCCLQVLRFVGLVGVDCCGFAEV